MKIHETAALVTGASRGLGEALARRLAARGARVALVARGEAELARVVESIRADGGEAHGIPADVGDKRAALAIVGAAAAIVGPIELLVNNASTLGHVPLRPLLDTECDVFERTLEVNVVGPFRLTKLVVSSMLLRGKGLVVNVTSDASQVPYADWGAYGASKAALDHLGRVFAAELEGTGVQVVSVDPGEMDTRMHADAVPKADRTSLVAPDVVAARIVRMIEASDSLPTGARAEAVAWGAAP